MTLQSNADLRLFFFQSALFVELSFRSVILHLLTSVFHIFPSVFQSSYSSAYRQIQHVAKHYSSACRQIQHVAIHYSSACRQFQHVTKHYSSAHNQLPTYMLQDCHQKSWVRGRPNNAEIGRGRCASSACSSYRQQCG